MTRSLHFEWDDDDGQVVTLDLDLGTIVAGWCLLKAWQQYCASSGGSAGPPAARPTDAGVGPPFDLGDDVGGQGRVVP